MYALPARPAGQIRDLGFQRERSFSKLIGLWRARIRKLLRYRRRLRQLSMNFRVVCDGSDKIPTSRFAFR